MLKIPLFVVREKFGTWDDDLRDCVHCRVDKRKDYEYGGKIVY